MYLHMICSHFAYISFTYSHIKCLPTCFILLTKMCIISPTHGYDLKGFQGTRLTWKGVKGTRLSLIDSTG